MIEPLFRFAGELTDNSEVVLDGDEGHHAVSVRRMRVGEPIALTNGLGLRARGMVSQVDRRNLAVRISSVLQEPPPTWPLTLIQAIAKGDRDELAIQAATEIGITTIVPWQADRSISRWDGKEAKGVERWQSIVDEASKQSLRSWFPSVSNPLNTQELSKLVAHQADEGIRFLVLDPTAEIGLGSILGDVTKLGKPTTVIVGPEGGITENELKSLESAGAVRVHLGKGILRTSTAGVAALAALTASSGAWG